MDIKFLEKMDIKFLRKKLEVKKFDKVKRKKKRFLDLKKVLLGPTPCILENLLMGPGGSSKDAIDDTIRSSAEKK